MGKMKAIKSYFDWFTSAENKSKGVHYEQVNRAEESEEMLYGTI